MTEMVGEDLKSAERDELVKKHGYKSFGYYTKRLGLTFRPEDC